MDVLNDHFTRARASGAVFARTVARPPWGLKLGGSMQLAVHMVVQGRGWLWFDDPSQTPLPLSPGDVTLVRGGPDHFIGSEPGIMCQEPKDFRAHHAQDGVASGPGAALFLCGAYRFTGDVGPGLLKALPQVVSFSPGVGDPLRDVVQLLSRELLHSEPGQNIVLDRLLDILLLLSMRTCFRQSTSPPAWFRASADLRVKPALEAMHEDASRNWSVPELAKLSGQSRAAFARAFVAVLGTTPMQYLIDWRMSLARDHLLNNQLSLGEIANFVGYASPYAFASAFRRHQGVPPGAWRKQAASATEQPTLDGVHRK